MTHVLFQGRTSGYEVLRFDANNNQSRIKRPCATCASIIRSKELSTSLEQALMQKLKFSRDNKVVESRQTVTGVSTADNEDSGKRTAEEQRAIST